MSISRRQLIKSGSVVGLASMTPTIVSGAAINSYKESSNYLSPLPESEILELASRAVEVAQSMGADYADARITRTVSQSFGYSEKSVVSASLYDTEILGIGVRVLKNGYWGFAASPYWDTEEAAILATEAVRQASANSSNGSRDIGWIPAPEQKGIWVSPGIDPFSISIEEKVDFVNAWRIDVMDFYDGIHKLELDNGGIKTERHEWCLVTSDGTSVSQISYGISGVFTFQAASKKGLGLPVYAKGVHSQQGGWEVIVEAGIKDQIPAMIEESLSTAGLGVTPVEIGRYDVVMDATTTARLVGDTFARTTQLDVALGLEANSIGTSYLGPDINDFLGASVASRLVNIRGDRSTPRSLATVKWDDEGIEPMPFDIVRGGHLVDYQTNRELNPRLREWHSKKNVATVSKGCASAQSALAFPLITSPNLTLEPSQSSSNIESMIQDIKRGYVIFDHFPRSDFQGKTGIVLKGMTASSYVREIVDGRLGGFVSGAGFLFNSDELWKNVNAVGGILSSQLVPYGSRKGEPAQYYSYTINSVPVRVKDMAVINPSRKA